MTVKELKEMFNKIIDGFKDKREKIIGKKKLIDEASKIAMEIGNDYHNILLYALDIKKIIDDGILGYSIEDFNSLVLIIKNEEFLKRTSQFELALSEVLVIKSMLEGIYFDNSELEVIDKAILEINKFIDKFLNNDLREPILDIDEVDRLIGGFDVNRRIEVLKLLIELNNKAYERCLARKDDNVSEEKIDGLFDEVDVNNLFQSDKREDKTDNDTGNSLEDRDVSDVLYYLNGEQKDIYDRARRIIQEGVIDKLPASYHNYKNEFIKNYKEIDETIGIEDFSFNDKIGFIKPLIGNLRAFLEVIDEAQDKFLVSDNKEELSLVKVIYLPDSDTANLLTVDSFCDGNLTTCFEDDLVNGVFVNDYNLIARFLSELDNYSSRVITNRGEHQLTIGSSSQYWVKKSPPSKPRLCWRKVSNDKEEHSVVMVIGVAKQYGNADGRGYIKTFDSRQNKFGNVIQAMIMKFNSDPEYREKVMRANLQINKRIEGILTGKKIDGDVNTTKKGSRG